MSEPWLIVWFALTLIGTAWVAFDLYTRTPAMSVMKPGWILVSLYMGPIGVLLYVLTCRPWQPGLEAHDTYIKPLWRQAAGSAVHCVAGDATGVIVASSIAAWFGIASALDVTLEYTFGFLFGLFIFQAVFMRAMMGGYWPAVKKTVMSEWLSMNMVMAGMIPVMVITMHYWSNSNHPTEPRYWFVMQCAAIVGYAVGYPMNYWLVGHGIKHGMMTQRPPEAKMPGIERNDDTGHDMGTMHHKLPPKPSTATMAIATIVSLLFLALGIALATWFGDLSWS